MGGCCSSAPPAPPDYSDPKCWQHIHGKVNGGGDHLPNGVAGPSGDPECDLFCVHATNIMMGGNAGWDSDGMEADQKKGAMLKAQFAWANNVCRVYSPKYRQVSVKVWLKLQVFGQQCKNNFDVVKEDMDAAFDEFLKTYCTNGRPFVLSGHSQGGYCVRYLLGKVDKDPELRKRLVCAYIAGCRVSADSYTNIPPAQGEADCGCWVSWCTTAAEGNSKTMNNEAGCPLMCGGERFGTGTQISHNPLSWTMTDEEAPASKHLGCLDPNGQMTSMKVSCRATNKDSKAGDSKGAGGCGGNLLITGAVPAKYKDDTMPSWDYHMGDMPCFWMNLRVNVEKRLETWKKTK
mmetsp:Transcript_110919/g.247711  ORF Transcript_110919/g.247711 Transcript_110919/m.247711 type:complete len:347 (+) Transcript_110919:99-1139(+)